MSPFSVTREINYGLRRMPRATRAAAKSKSVMSLASFLDCYPAIESLTPFRVRTGNSCGRLALLRAGF
jgi:hypothetical protein